MKNPDDQMWRSTKSRERLQIWLAHVCAASLIVFVILWFYILPTIGLMFLLGFLR